MGRYVLGFAETDRTQVAVGGGKGAHLGELSRIEGVRVPAGLCVTTDAFRRLMAKAPSINERLDWLSRLEPNNREAIRALREKGDIFYLRFEELRGVVRTNRVDDQLIRERKDGV